MKRLLTAPTAAGVCGAMCAIVEVVLLGWWAVTRATVIFIVLEIMLFAVIWLGLFSFRHRQFKRDYERTIAENAILEDRNRLADELHDTLGHELSVIALKAGSLQVHAGGPAQTKAAEIRRDVEQAVQKLHQALEAARDSSANEPIEAMLARLTAAGVSITRTGTMPSPLAEIVEQAAYQVVREGLTNALRHAPGQPVTIAYATSSTLPTVLQIDIRNPVHEGSLEHQTTQSAGTGLGALRRRIELLGGELTAASGQSEFVTTARIPTRPPRTHTLRRRPQRSPLRQTLRSALLPTAAVTAVVLGFYAWAIHGTVIEEPTFEMLHIGMATIEAEALLPSREAPVRVISSPSPVHESTWTCAYYTDGNFPLGFAVFEVCFDDGAIAGLTDLRKQPWL